MLKPFNELSQEQIEALQLDLIAYSRSVRGHILEVVTVFELNIDTFLSSHFIPYESDKFDELLNLIISPRMGFEQKTQVMFYLLQKHHSDSFISKFKKDDIIKIIEHRNVFAHYPSNVQLEAIKDFYENGMVSYYKFKNATTKENGKNVSSLSNIVYYSQELIKEIINAIYDYSDRVISCTAPFP